jgi:hypothetical protein
MRLLFPLSVVFLCGLCISQTNPSPDKHDKSANTQSGVSTNKPQQKSPVSSPSDGPVGQPSTNSRQTQEQNPTEKAVYRVNVISEPTSGWTKAYVFITALLGLAGLGTLYILWRQANVAQDAANAARDAATAAKNSSEAIVNSERPWLFITISTAGSSGALDQNGVLQHLTFSVKFRNCGKTPAEVIGFDQHLDCRENDMSNLPFPPKYGLEGHVMAHTRMVPSGEVWRDIGEDSFLAEQYVLDTQWNDIRSSRKRLVYWGRLQYRDLIRESKSIHELKDIGLIHETCFCYFWSPARNEFLVWGHFGYNKHT